MDDIIVCVDQTIVTLRKVVICGWAISRVNGPVSIKNNIKHVNLTITSRPDISRAHGCTNDRVGFIIEVHTFQRMNLVFSSDVQEKTLSYSCLNLRRKRFVEVIQKVGTSLKKRGIMTTLKMILCRLQGKAYIEKDSQDYETWYAHHKVSEEDLMTQKAHVFPYEPLISIVIPIYNTPLSYLKDVIASVMEQSYRNWELILVDGHSTKQETTMCLKSLDDPQIQVVWLEENRMISNNTNEGVKVAKGEYIGLVDHDDLLTPDALFCMVEKLNEHPYDMVYSDEDKINSDSTHIFQPHFKPDFSIDTLRSYNYITHFTILKKAMLDEVGIFDSACDGAQDYDLFLRFAAKTDKIAHVPRILYHWRVHQSSTAQDVSAKTYVLDAGKLALNKHLKEVQLQGTVMDGMFPTAYRIVYELKEKPLISILIPNKDHISDLKKCIDSILERTFYDNYEIIVIENNSIESKTFAYYEELEQKYKKIRVVHWKDAFNYSAINNYGARCAKGDYFVLLNNDIEIVSGTWLEEMLMFAQRNDIGAVGAKLYYPNNTIQHAGVIVGIGGVAGHSHKYYPRNDDGYFGRLKIAQNVSAVTAACLMVSKQKYEEVQGLEEGYQVAFNDVDFCMKLLEKGYRNVFTPYAEMIHYESLSRGAEDSPEKVARFNSEIQRFEKRWGLWLEDPCYNPNLSNTCEDFSLRNQEDTI